MQSLTEKKWWMPLCVAVLTVAAIAVSLVLLYAPRGEEPPQEASETVTASVVTPTSRPTPAPTPEPTASPVITPPAQSATSGSDVILTHVPLSSGSDLNAGPETDM